MLVPNDIGNNSLPTFAWSIAANTSRYELWVDDITTSATTVIHETHLTEESYIADHALPVGRYRSWVRSYDLAGNPRAFSAGLDFQVTLAATTTLLSPESFSSSSAANLIFAWTQTAAATGNYRYELWVNDVTNSVARVIHETNLQTQSFVPPTPLTAGLYRAWIRLFGSGGNVLPWSSGVTFTVG